MSDAAAFRATYSDWRLIKGRKVVQVVFEVPIEQANLAYQVLDGMPNPAAETWCAIARLNPETELMPAESYTTDTPPASGPDIPARARKSVDSDKRLTQRSGILCNDPLFIRYLVEKHQLDTATMSPPEFVRNFCRVGSRVEIKPNTEAGLRWDLLESAFVVWRDVPEYADAS